MVHIGQEPLFRLSGLAASRVTDPTELFLTAEHDLFSEAGRGDQGEERAPEAGFLYQSETLSDMF